MGPVYTLLLLAAVPCSVWCGHVPAPRLLKMHSRRFIHMLTWEAGPGAPAGLYYRVTFCSYKNSWRTVDSCAEVRSPLLCNMTDVLSDLDEIYYINVTAVLGEETSVPLSYHPPFSPVKDTEAEPPSVRLSACNVSLCVHLRSPSPRLEDVYKKFRYTLNVTDDTGLQLFSRNTRGLDTVELKLVPGRQYCVSVHIANRSSANKTVVCSEPAASSNMDAVIPVLLLMTLIIAAGVALLVLQRSGKTEPPLILRSFKAPYQVRLLFPSVESLKCVSLVLDTRKHAEVNEDADHETEDEEVAYESLKGCKEVPEETSASLAGSPGSHKRLYTHTLQELTNIIALHHHHQGAAFPRTLTTPILKLNQSDKASPGSTTGHEDVQVEDGDGVNFFSVILGSQNVEPREEERQTETALKPKPEGPLQPAPDSIRHISYSEEDEEEDTGEEEDTEEEEAFSGYMMRS